MRGHAGWLVATLMLAGCAGHAVAPVAELPPAAPAVVNAAPAVTPLNAGLTPAATLWHLRAALNVAALGCRGADEATTVAGYNALIATHAATLKAAQDSYTAQYRATGGDWRDRYDDDQTRLYNFFGQVRGHDAFCAAATETLAAAATVTATTLPAFAADRLPALDRPFAPPRLMVDARVYTAAMPVAYASR